MAVKKLMFQCFVCGRRTRATLDHIASDLDLLAAGLKDYLLFMKGQTDLVAVRNLLDELVEVEGAVERVDLAVVELRKLRTWTAADPLPF